MTNTYILLAPILVSFLVSLFFLPSWINRAKKAGLVGKDMHKPRKSLVAEGGGITIIAGFILGTLLYIALKTFYFKTTTNIIESFALITVVLIISLIGLIDDLFGWKLGLRKRYRILLVFLAAIPLMVINAGESVVTLPLIGRINLGLIYPLLVIPIGVLGASTTFNFLAGFNGLEARQGILMLGALAIATWLTGNSWLAVINLIMIASLIAFLFYNLNPAKVFPGNVMTYAVGALIASTAILGNLERFAVFIFIPNIIEVFLKLRGKLKVESFGKVKRDGSLDIQQDKICGLTHLSIKLIKKIKGKVYENDVVLAINIFQILIIILGFIVFKGGIF